MENIQKGQKVHNSRTNDNGVVVGFSQYWNGRHTVKKLVVDVLGTQKTWAYSSCKVVEDLAPRALVRLKDILNVILANKEKCLAEIKAIYPSSNGQSLLSYDLREDLRVLTADCVSAAAFRGLTALGFVRTLAYIEYASISSIIKRDNIAITSFSECGRLSSELFSIYMDRNPNSM